jgi:hypothetical protein
MANTVSSVYVHHLKSPANHALLHHLREQVDGLSQPSTDRNGVYPYKSIKHSAAIRFDNHFMTKEENERLLKSSLKYEKYEKLCSYTLYSVTHDDLRSVC